MIFVYFNLKSILILIIKFKDRISPSLWCNPIKLSFLGAGYPLFFDFIKWCIVILLIIFCTSGFFNIVTNRND